VNDSLERGPEQIAADLAERLANRQPATQIRQRRVLTRQQRRQRIRMERGQRAEAESIGER